VHQCARKFSKSEKMGAKFVRTTSAIYKRGERKFLPWPFITYVIDNLLPRLVTGCHKTVNFIEVVPKAHESAIVCAHRHAIMPCNF